MRKLLSLIFICATIILILGCTQETEGSAVESAAVMRSMSMANNTEEVSEETDILDVQKEEVVDYISGPEALDLEDGTDVSENAQNYSVKCDWIFSDPYVVDHEIWALVVVYRKADNTVNQDYFEFIGNQNVNRTVDHIDASKIIGVYIAADDTVIIRKLNYDIKPTDEIIHLNQLDFIQGKKAYSNSR